MEDGGMARKKLLSGKRILIVDDEPDVLETLEELLDSTRITKVDNYKDAKQLLETKRFDIAVLDIMGVDGYELLQIATEKKITAVILTAHALSPEHTARSQKGGAALYVPKDKIVDIATYLEDVLEAEQEGKSTWWRWIDRFADYYDEKFEKDWQFRDKDFWKSFPYA